MTYIDNAIDVVTRQLPSEDPAPIRLYALLALVVGDDVTREHVHDAWAMWRSTTMPQHPAIRPFDELSATTQDLDQPYVDAIRYAVHSLAPSVPVRHASPACACGINEAGQRYIDPICVVAR
jgi:hypothetical protein